MTNPATTPADGELKDNFQGNDAHLVDCIRSLIRMNDAGVLVPHGIGGHARAMLSAAAVRLSRATPSPGKADERDAVQLIHEYISGLLANDVEKAKKATHDMTSLYFKQHQEADPQ